MLGKPSRLRLLAETARQRAVQERALLLGDDANLEINWGTLVDDDISRDAAHRSSRDTGRRSAAKWPPGES